MEESKVVPWKKDGAKNKWKEKEDEKRASRRKEESKPTSNTTSPLDSTSSLLHSLLAALNQHNTTQHFPPFIALAFYLLSIEPRSCNSLPDLYIHYTHTTLVSSAVLHKHSIKILLVDLCADMFLVFCYYKCSKLVILHYIGFFKNYNYFLYQLFSLIVV